MPLIKYQEIRFSSKVEDMIQKANQIIQEYAAQGFELTLRQLYYQFVSRMLIENKQSEYKRLGSIVNNARLAGLIDWNRIVDRTRNLQELSHWDSPGDLVQSCADQFRVDMWKGQTFRPEVWIEKDALVGVIQAVCEKYDVPYFSCRGYTSQSEMWSAGQRFEGYKESGQEPIIFHLGDHDPSGKDMTRDTKDRMVMFMGGMDVKRIALNIDQIKKYNPPPNPCKITDSRAINYMREFGKKSWELDALDPKVIADLIEKNIKKIIDDEPWEERAEEGRQGRKLLQKVARDM